MSRDPGSVPHCTTPASVGTGSGQKTTLVAGGAPPPEALFLRAALAPPPPPPNPEHPGWTGSLPERRSLRGVLVSSPCPASPGALSQNPWRSRIFTYKTLAFPPPPPSELLRARDALRRSCLCGRTATSCEDSRGLSAKWSGRCEPPSTRLPGLPHLPSPSVPSRAELCRAG